MEDILLIGEKEKTMTLPFLQSARPSFDSQLCSKCGQCANICPDDVISMDSGMPTASEGVFMGCIACGHCACVCPVGAISVEGNGLSGDDTVELSPPGERADADQLAALLTARRSIRRFKQNNVDRKDIDKILAMVSTAPMGIPPSPVGVSVYEGRKKVQQFAQGVCDACERSDRFFNPIVLGVMRLFMKKADFIAMRDFVKPLCKMLARERKAGRDVFAWDAPLALLFHHGPFSDAADVHIAATYAVLAAESLGLGSCMLGTSVVVNYDKKLKAKCGIPAENKVGLAVVIGYPAVKFHSGIRRRLQSINYA